MTRPFVLRRTRPLLIPIDAHARQLGGGRRGWGPHAPPAVAAIVSTRPLGRRRRDRTRQSAAEVDPNATTEPHSRISSKGTPTTQSEGSARQRVPSRLAGTGRAARSRLARLIGTVTQDSRRTAFRTAATRGAALEVSCPCSRHKPPSYGGVPLVRWGRRGCAQRRAGWGYPLHDHTGLELHRRLRVDVAVGIVPPLRVLVVPGRGRGRVLLVIGVVLLLVVRRRVVVDVLHLLRVGVVDVLLHVLRLVAAAVRGGYPAWDAARVEANLTSAGRAAVHGRGRNVLELIRGLGRVDDGNLVLAVPNGAAGRGAVGALVVGAVVRRAGARRRGRRAGARVATGGAARTRTRLTVGRRRVSVGGPANWRRGATAASEEVADSIDQRRLVAERSELVALALLQDILLAAVISLKLRASWGPAADWGGTTALLRTTWGGRGGRRPIPRRNALRRRRCVALGDMSCISRWRLLVCGRKRRNGR